MIQPGTSRRLLLGPGLPLLLALLAFGGSIRAGFTGDDLEDVLAHPVVNGQAPLHDLLRYNLHGEPVERGQHLLRPFSTLLFALEHRIFGPDPLPFHLLSLALYLLAVWIAQLLLRELLPAGLALAGAALFAALAIHAEPVAAIAFRSELLALLFSLLGLLAAARGRLAWVAPAYAAALLCKESALLLPFLVALLWWARPATTPQRSRLVVLGLLAVLGLAFVAHRLSLGRLDAGVVLPDNLLLAAGPAVRIWTGLALLGRYLFVTLWPLGLACDHSYSALHPRLDASWPEAWLGLAALLGLGAMAALALRRAERQRPESRLLLLACGGFLLSYALVSNSLLLITILFAERLFLAPSLWLLLIALALARRLLAWRPRLGPALLALAALVILWQVPLAVRATSAWRDELSLATAQVQAEPRSVKGHLYLARALQGRGRGEEALLELAISMHGRRRFPAPWSPPRLVSGPTERRLLALLREIEPSLPEPALLAGFRAGAREALGPAAAREVEQLAARLGWRPRR